MGYALLLLISDALTRAAESAEAAEPQIRPKLISRLGRWRWYWIPAIYALALLFVLMITITQEGGVGQMMYRGF